MAGGGTAADQFGAISLSCGPHARERQRDGNYNRDKGVDLVAERGVEGNSGEDDWMWKSADVSKGSVKSTYVGGRASGSP